MVELKWNDPFNNLNRQSSRVVPTSLHFTYQKCAFVGKRYVSSLRSRDDPCTLSVNYDYPILYCLCPFWRFGVTRSTFYGITFDLSAHLIGSEYTEYSSRVVYGTTFDPNAH